MTPIVIVLSFLTLLLHFPGREHDARWYRYKEDRFIQRCQI